MLSNPPTKCDNTRYIARFSGQPRLRLLRAFGATSLNALSKLTESNDASGEWLHSALITVAESLSRHGG